MHSAINIREIVRNSIDGGASGSSGDSGPSSLRYSMNENSSSSGGGTSGGGCAETSVLTPGNINGISTNTNGGIPSSGKGKRKRNTHEDPMSHRIIEKRRRDRMNNCLADLSRLIPSSYSKKERGRIEKTEIIEMAIRHLKNIQAHCTCGIFDSPEVDHLETSSTAYVEDPTSSTSSSLSSNISMFKSGYDECTGEVVNFLVESEGFYVGDSLCVRLTRHLGRNFAVKYKGGSISHNFKRHSQSRISSNSSSGYVANVTSSSSSDTGSNGRGHKHNEAPSEFYIHRGNKYLKEGGGYSLPECVGTPPTNANSVRGSWSHGLKPTQYKFKSNMHERFSHQRPYDPSETGSKQYRKSEQISPLDYSTHISWASLHRSSGEESLFKPYSHIETSHSSAKLDKFQTSSSSSIPRSNVPIFALHPKEGYYMALSVDSSLIDPYLILFTQIDKASLHPITISVNFCGPMALAFGSYSNSSRIITNNTQTQNSQDINNEMMKNENESNKKNDAANF